MLRKKFIFEVLLFGLISTALVSNAMDIASHDKMIETALVTSPTVHVQTIMPSS